MRQSLFQSSNSDIIGEDFDTMEDDINRIPQRSHYSRLPTHFSNEHSGCQIKKPMIRVHSSYVSRDRISDMRGGLPRYTSKPIQRFDEAQKPGTRIVLVPRGNLVGNRERPMAAGTSRGVIRVDSTGNRFIQFPNGSVSQIKTRTVSQMPHRGPRYIVPNERANMSQSYSTRPLLFDFEADEAKEREISEAIAREEELMRLEDERNSNSLAGFGDDYRYLPATNTSSNDSYTRSWQSETMRQQRFSNPRTQISYPRASTTLYSSPTQLYGTDSKELKICKMVLASIVNQVCGAEESEQRESYRSVEVNPPDIVTLECLPSFYNQRVALNRRYPLHQRQPEECLIEHIENYKREVNRRRAVLENIAQEELGMLLPWRRSRTKNARAIRKLRDSEDAMCDPRLISLGGNTTETKDVSFKMESIATNDEPTAYIPATTNATHLDEEKEIQENLSILESPKQAADNKRNKRNLQSSSTDKTDSEDQEGGKKSGSKRVHSVDSQKKEVSSKVQPSSHKPTSKRQNRLNQLQQQDNDADDENEASGRSVVDGSSKYCICGSISGPADSKKFYISCSKCKSYFHGKCVGLTEKKAQKLSGSWTCADCEKQKSSTEELYCVCRQPYNDKRFYVGCDSCEDWFHPECINTTQQEISQFEEFICPKCRE